MEHVWKSEGNLVELVPSFHFYVVPGVEFRWSGWHSKPFYLLSLVTRPGGGFL